MIKTKLRKQPITEANKLALGQSYRQMYVLAALMELEYTNFMDINFRSPITHQKITQTKHNIDYVMQKHKLAVDTSKADEVLFALDDLNAIIKLLTNLSPNQLSEYVKGLKGMNL